ncbi:MAG: hypothetical protein OXI22_10950 [Defluviicoccus sp.]|nr:hypothetical protein [Defluviicoccus sp.]
MRVLVIPEDFRNDQYLLKPLFKRLFATMGRRNVRVRVCQDPLLGGVDEALKSERIQEVVEQHDGMTDIFILCVDRDGVLGRRQRLDQLEGEFANDRTFLAQNAWEEIETWVLAGLDLPRGWRWADVRAEVQVKERYFDVLADGRGVADGPGGGRETLGDEAARNITAIRQKCPEDFDALAQRLEALP